MTCSASFWETEIPSVRQLIWYLLAEYDLIFCKLTSFCVTHITWGVLVSPLTTLIWLQENGMFYNLSNWIQKLNTTNLSPFFYLTIKARDEAAIEYIYILVLLCQVIVSGYRICSEPTLYQETSSFFRSSKLQTLEFQGLCLYREHG